MTPVAALLAGMTLDERVDQLLLAYPQVNAGPVTVGGVLFVGPGFDAEEMRAVVASTSARAEIPPFFATDLEGGAVNRLRSLPSLASLPSASALGRLSDAQVEVWGYRVGTELRRIGVNLDLAPVLDLADHGHLADDRRTFGSDPAVVAARGRAFVRGLDRAGVGSITKHFPGYGDLVADSDQVPVLATWTAERVAVGIQVFGEVESSGIMVSHAAYAAFGGAPAVFVPAVVDLARAHGGLVVTDDLAVTALAVAAGSPEDAVRSAFLAGSDLLVTTAPPDWPGGVDYHAVLMDLVREDPTLRARVDASVLRILTVKQHLGLFDDAVGGP